MTAATAETSAACRVSFRSGHPPVPLPALAGLSESLTVRNSPVLFGCRTGICGTCVSRVEPAPGAELPPPSAEEAELLAVVAPGEPRARLLCQLRLTGDILVEPLTR